MELRLVVTKKLLINLSNFLTKKGEKMSERITISLKDSELLEIENLAKSEGSTVRDIINRRIRESKN